MKFLTIITCVLLLSCQGKQQLFEQRIRYSRPDSINFFIEKKYIDMVGSEEEFKALVETIEPQYNKFRIFVCGELCLVSLYKNNDIPLGYRRIYTVNTTYTVVGRFYDFGN